MHDQKKPIVKPADEKAVPYLNCGYDPHCDPCTATPIGDGSYNCPVLEKIIWGDNPVVQAADDELRVPFLKCGHEPHCDPCVATPVGDGSYTCPLVEGIIWGE